MFQKLRNDDDTQPHIPVPAVPLPPEEHEYVLETVDVTPEMDHAAKAYKYMYAAQQAVNHVKNALVSLLAYMNMYDQALQMQMREMEKDFETLDLEPSRITRKRKKPVKNHLRMIVKCVPAFTGWGVFAAYELLVNIVH